ncbi:MAG: hypothetical protein QM270_10865 [Bacillota bacterium]|nr:hypothetical protein [Bacillota bacterium]
MRRRQREAAGTWMRLDNASKIFPATANAADTKVYRLYCELRAKVDPELLQTALDRTLLRFPWFRMALGRGLFWYYFESSDLPARVEADCHPLFAPLHDTDRRRLPFRVLHHGRRIAVEVFHALSDGTGSFSFLRCLVSEYLRLRHPELDIAESEIVDIGSSQRQHLDDSFRRWFRQRPPRVRRQAAASRRSILRRRALQIPGAHAAPGCQTVIEAGVPLSAALECSRAAGVSLTVWLAALLLQAIYEDQTPQRSGLPAVIDVPVNLRRIFPSASARNFFGLLSLEHHRPDPAVVPPLEELLPLLAGQLRQQLEPAGLQARAARLLAFERQPLIRILPTVLKDPILSLIHRLADRGATSSLSNLGVVAMPAACRPHIAAFGSATSTRSVQICATSFGDRLTLCLTSALAVHEVERLFVRRLVRAGLEVEVTSNTEWAAALTAAGGRESAEREAAEREAAAAEAVESEPADA